MSGSPPAAIVAFEYIPHCAAACVGRGGEYQRTTGRRQGRAQQRSGSRQQLRAIKAESMAAIAEMRANAAEFRGTMEASKALDVVALNGGIVAQLLLSVIAVLAIFPVLLCDLLSVGCKERSRQLLATVSCSYLARSRKLPLSPG